MANSQSISEDVIDATGLPSNVNDYQEFLTFQRQALTGEINGGANPDGTLRPPELHFSDEIIYDTNGNNIVAGNIDELHPGFRADFNRFKAEFEKTHGEAARFNLATLRLFYAGAKIDWSDESVGGRPAQQILWYTYEQGGSAKLKFGMSHRFAEGCDKNLDPFPDDEPIFGSRDCFVRKRLYDQYRNGTIGYGEYMKELHQLFAGRPADREPLVISAPTLAEKQFNSIVCKPQGKYLFSITPNPGIHYLQVVVRTI